MTREVELNTTIEHPRYGECEVFIYANVEPIVRGRTYGDPGDCYPDEGGEVEITKAIIDCCYRCEGKCEHEGIEFDINELPREMIRALEDEAAECALEDEARAYEDAMEDRAEEAWDR